MRTIVLLIIAQRETSLSNRNVFVKGICERRNFAFDIMQYINHTIKVKRRSYFTLLLIWIKIAQKFYFIKKRLQWMELRIVQQKHSHESWYHYEVLNYIRPNAHHTYMKRHQNKQWIIYSSNMFSSRYCLFWSKCYVACNDDIDSALFRVVPSNIL